MKLKIALTTATALGLIMATSAYADSNRTYIHQNGSGNSADISQNNLAVTGNQAGTSVDAMSQSGSDNVLTIVQDGDNGQIGVKTGTDDYYTPGHLSPNSPQFSITYQGVNQTSSGAGSNEASLTQHGTGSVIGELQQDASGLATGNSATVEQTDDNTINHIWQTQSGGAAKNVIQATESGSGNVIDRIDQRAVGTTAGTNQITVDISGSGNGIMDYTGLSGFYSSRAWVAGATESALIQNNYGSMYGVTDPTSVAGNVINLTITGNGNEFGMTQKGINNTTGTVLISGNNNIFGSYQAGQGNVIGAGEIAGSNNDVGIWQAGSTNSASVSMLAAGSDYNGLSIWQQGTSNVATVSITGSNNGTGSLAGVAGNLRAANPATLFTGTILQGGSLSSHDNNADLTIYGDGNAFAIASLGSDNHVTGNIGTVSADASNNSVAVLQSGSSNIATFSQSGSGNAAAISQ